MKLSNIVGYIVLASPLLLLIIGLMQGRVDKLIRENELRDKP